MCESFLHIRWLQLGLVAAACITAMSQKKITCYGCQGAPGVPHRRMVCGKNMFTILSNSPKGFTIHPLFFTLFLFVSHSSGVHHKKKNCESNQVISKVQQVLRIATKSHQLYPKSLTLTVASVLKKSKLRKGNGGWSDVRDHNLCLNVTWSSFWLSS